MGAEPHELPGEQTFEEQVTADVKVPDDDWS